jgi:hypothetical protein
LSDPDENHLRIELTVLDPKLFREKAEWPSGLRSTLLFCTPYEDAVSPPFPSEGKQGLSVWVGPLAAFKAPKARLLWELEKRRKRPTMVVLTSQKGRSFLRACREIGTVLGDTSIAPASFLRRRGQEWDSLDFLSAGDSSFMEGANPRLKRLKQAGWEALVDRVALIDPAVKAEYFETLHVPRETLIASATKGFRQLKVSPLIGIAGECLTRDSLYGLFEEPLLRAVVNQVKGQAPPSQGDWLLLAHRAGGSEILFYGNGSQPLEVGQIMRGQVGDQTHKSEFAVAQVKQLLFPDRDPQGPQVFCSARVDWRYPPEREIPTLWKQKTALSAGSQPLHG